MGGGADRTARGAPVAIALLTVVATAIAILVSHSWSKVVFVIFAVVVAVLSRPRTSRAEVIRMALLIGGIAVLGNVSLYLIGWSSFADAVVCTFEPCPWLGPTMLLAGIAAALGATVGIAGLVRSTRRGRAHLLLSALNVLLVGWFAFLLVDNPGSGAVVETGGLAAVAGVLRRVPAKPRLLRAAVFAQAADLAMFGFVWQLGQGEQNPLGRWTIETLLALGPGDAYPAVAAGMMLIMAKLALIAFLIWVTPNLGRYRRTVLTVATLAGTAGAVVSVVTRLPSG